MTSAIAFSMLYALGILSVFLLIGFVLRRWVPVLQRTCMPASVIGGFLLLIVGPQGLGLFPLPKDYMAFFSLLPGLLIVPIVTSVPLGLTFVREKSVLRTVLPLTAIAMAISFLQFAGGFGIQWLVVDSFHTYPTFGWELGLGFAGGHGTAGLLANMLQSMGLSYWKTAQGVAITTATVGLVGGTIGGIALINWGARRGHTVLLKNPETLPIALRRGYEVDPKKQPSLGRETTSASALDALAFHAALILGVCVLAFGVLQLLKLWRIPVLSSLSIWFYGLVLMSIVWGAMYRMGLEHLVDTKIKGKIAGSLTEFAVVAAIGSLPLQAVSAYWEPLVFLCLYGLVATFLFLYWVCKWLVREYWFEQALAFIGMYTGVFMTGLLLLRVCDPELESPVLGRYSLAYTVSGLIYFAILELYLHSLLAYGAGWMSFFSFLATLLCIGIAWILTPKQA